MSAAPGRPRLARTAARQGEGTPVSERLQVHLDFGPGSTPLLLGECLWIPSERSSAFQWSASGLESGYRLSPLHLPLVNGVLKAPTHPFAGLHGIFNDSLPDGFGLRLMNRSLASAGYDLGRITPVDRLAWVGDRGLGALTYRPIVLGSSNRQLMDVSELGIHAVNAQADNFADVPDAVIKAGGSAHGARPKFWASVSSDGAKVILGDHLQTPDGFTACLVKFPPAVGDKSEPFYEAACLQLAEMVGVKAAKGRLLAHKHGAALAIERFDRLPGGGRLFVQSLAALLHDDFRFPKLDYHHLAQLSHKLSGVTDTERIYRQCCFNVALSMRDDHSKNFAFCMDKPGTWELSPAYDLCPNEGPSGWQTMAVSGECRDISRNHLLAFAEKLGLSISVAKDGIDKALSASSGFEALAVALGSQKSGARKWSKIFREIAKRLAPAVVAAGAKNPIKRPLGRS
jgi:serine/threonine-protein kinase HipA